MPADTEPHGRLSDRGWRKVYVTNILSDLVTAIDKATNTPKRTF